MHNEGPDGKWRELITEQEGSGESVRAFALKRGFSAATFYRWRNRLVPPATTDLVPVEVVKTDLCRPGGATFELRLGQETTLMIPPSFDLGDLRRILEALRC
jgi:hypothetical protein